MIRVVICILLGGVPAAFAADYCSLVVRVLSPDNKRFFQVLVSVQEESGRVTRKEADSEDARFCDLGISPVTVTVGEDACNQVVVRNVPLEWEEEYILRITYDREPCMQSPPPRLYPVCRLLFRIADSTGNWLQKASVTFAGGRFPKAETDHAGRIMVVPRKGERVTGTVAATGYSNKTFSGACPGSDRSYDEEVQVVVLSRAEAQ